MPNYLLLRSNKQSGPYSLDEIVQLGLKPYDLVWVDGKSAAWRYPSEIPELKPYSPVVEEQPYDRFYKRSPEPQKEEKEKKQDTKIAESPEIVESVKAVTENKEQVPPAKKKEQPVFISMPRKKETRVMVIGPTERQAKVVELNSKESPTQKEDNLRFLPQAEKQSAVSGALTRQKEETPELETKYEQSLDEIKDLYKQTLLERKNRYSRKSRFKKAGRYALILFYVGALGTLIFLTVSRKPGSAELYAGKEKPDSRNKTAGDDYLQSLQPTGTDNNNALNASLNVPSQESDLNAPGNTAQKIQNRPASALSPVENDPGEQVYADLEDKPVTGNINSEGERNKPVRDQAGNKPFSRSGSISDMVFVNANGYKKVAFGGIKDLQLTVSNDSKYILDLVKVELTYLKPSELPLKSEIIEFRSVAPNGTMTIKIPDTNRGIDVTYKIKEVVSSQLNSEVVKSK